MPEQEKPDFRLTTRLVHEGERLPAPRSAPTSMPIYPTSTFTFESFAELDAAFEESGASYTYARYGNPTLTSLEQVMAAAEGGLGAISCASGMSALYIGLLAAGTPRGASEPHPRHILAARDLYGSTYRLLRDFFEAQGTPVTYCDVTDLQALEQALAEHRPDVVLVETLSNPLLLIADIPAIVERTRAAGARLVVDATMTTPILSRPLTQGADIVVHSASKYLGGHGDVIAGMVVARSSLVLDTARQYVRLLGTILGPFEARMVSRGIKTLDLRVRRQCENALAVARYLQEHPRVTRVHYPGLEEHPQHAIAARDFGGLFGAMVTFEIAGADKAAIFACVDRMRLILPATSLGDIYTLVSYPAIASHREVSAEERQALGIGDGVLRLSIGIEHPDDLIADLERALG
jgi:cystathionine gamma-synthase